MFSLPQPVDVIVPAGSRFLGPDPCWHLPRHLPPDTHTHSYTWPWLSTERAAASALPELRNFPGGSKSTLRFCPSWIKGTEEGERPVGTGAAKRIPEKERFQLAQNLCRWEW